MDHAQVEEALRAIQNARAPQAARDKTQNPAFFGYRANANGHAVDMKKALPRERLREEALFKDRKLEVTKRKAEVEQELAEKQVAAGGINAANRLKALPPGIRLEE